MLTSKPEVRAQIRAARRALDAGVRQRADAALSHALVRLIGASGARTVAAYVPRPAEPGGAELVARLTDASDRLLLPILLDDFDLDWAVHDGALRPAARGLREPGGARLGRDAIARADLVVVPGLAVDHAGVRLGQGGGSYDRALTRTAAPTIVPLYPGERVPTLPAEPHDLRVNAALVGYETAHLYWTEGAPMPHYWHSE